MAQATPAGDGDGKLQRLILEQIDEVVYMTRPGRQLFHDRLLFISPRVEAILGYEPQAFMDEPSLWFNLVHPDDMQGLIATTQQLVEQKVPVTRLYRLRHRHTGSYRWMEDRVVPQLDDAGNLVATFGVARDITHRVEAAEALRQSEERYRRLVEMSPEAIAVHQEGIIVYANPAAARLLGAPDPPALMGRAVLDFVHPDDRPLVIRRIYRLLQGSSTVERIRERFRRLDGGTVEVEVAAAAISFQGRPAVQVVVHDLTERLRREETLQTIAAGISPETGHAFFQWLCRHLASSLQVDYAYVAEIPPDQPDQMRTVAVFAQGQAAPNFTVPLAGTPCAQVLVEGSLHVASGVQARFPDYPLLRQWGAEGYLGAALRDADGAPLGLLVVVHRQPLPEVEQQMAMLHIFAARAGAELARLRAERERQRLARRLAVAQEEERRQVARELHDEIGQALTALRLMLEAQPQPDASRLAEAVQLVDEIAAQAGDLSLRLRPSILDDLGLLPALLQQTQRFQEQTGIQVRLSHRGLKGRRFGPEIEMAAYRLVQEALTNVARHAGVSEAQVRLWATESELGVQVEERGQGFPVAETLAAGQSAGLAGMRERVRLLQGRLEIDSAPGAGTRISASLPLPGAGAAKPPPPNTVL